MTLRLHTVLGLGLLLLALLAGVAAHARATLLARLAVVEEEEAQLNAQRAVAALGEQLTDLGDLTEDYSYWDQTYAFMESRDPAFVTSIPTAATSPLHVQAIALVDPEGTLVLGRSLDIEKRLDGPLPPDVAARLSDPRLYRARDGRREIEGLLVVGTRPLLVAIRPVLTSGGGGASRGTLVIARDIDAWQVDKLTRYTRYNMTFSRPDDPAAPDDVRAMAPRLVPGKIVSLVRDDTFVSAYTMIEDIESRPALVLRVDTFRRLHQEGERVSRRLRTLLLLTAAAWTAALLALFGRHVRRGQAPAPPSRT